MWLKAARAWVGFNKTASLIIAAVVAFSGYSAWVYNKGGTGIQLRQANEQIKQDDKTTKAHAKIDRATPFSADKKEAGIWLLGQTRKQ